MVKKKNKISYIIPSKKNTKKTQSKNNNGFWGRLSGIQRLIIGIIVCAIIVVLAALVCSFVFKPENTVKSKIDNLASDYYENFFYERIVESNNSDDAVKKVVSEYKDTGLTPVSLRQLILHDTQKNYEIGKYLKNYCDENNTVAKFYPEEPFDKTSYRIEYTYSCEF